MKGVCCFSLLVPRVYLPAWCHRTGQEFMHLRFFVSVVLLLWFPGASGSLSSQVDEDSKAQDKQWLENDFIKTTYDISLDSLISLFSRGFSPLVVTDLLTILVSILSRDGEDTETMNNRHKSTVNKRLNAKVSPARSYQRLQSISSSMTCISRIKQRNENRPLIHLLTSHP